MSEGCCEKACSAATS